MADNEFWEDSEHTSDYLCAPLTPSAVQQVEDELQYKLPESYLQLMTTQNGGFPVRTCCPTTQPTSWAEDHIQITGFLGVGRDTIYSLCGQLGSEFHLDEWGYPRIGVCICNCPSAGHDMVMLDYSDCGPDGEPRVVHVDQERDYKITILADNFAQFIGKLVNESEYDRFEETLAEDLHKVREGTFSTLLNQLLSTAPNAGFELALRKAGEELTKQKGHFSLHDDELSDFINDVQFYLCVQRGIKNKDEFFDLYREIVVFGDGGFTTGGYAPAFIEEWYAKRKKQREIIKWPLLPLRVSKRFEKRLLETANSYGS